MGLCNLRCVLLYVVAFEILVAALCVLQVTVPDIARLYWGSDDFSTVVPGVRGERIMVIVVSALAIVLAILGIVFAFLKSKIGMAVFVIGESVVGVAQCVATGFFVASFAQLDNKPAVGDSILLLFPACLHVLVLIVVIALGAASWRQIVLRTRNVPDSSKWADF